MSRITLHTIINVQHTCVWVMNIDQSHGFDRNMMPPHVCKYYFKAYPQFALIINILYVLSHCIPDSKDTEQ